ncbi:MAG: metallophosphoesterase family protein [Xanthomonadales bacterium]|jgi:hypothetical protein|nr:metallophosphoesterase family protein [Xanthomonadales bacterium]
MNLIPRLLSGLWLALLAGSLAAHEAPDRPYQPPEYAPGWSAPGPHPDRIVLNFSDDPATTISVSWRTDTSVEAAVAEIAPATPAPKFWRHAVTRTARTERMDGSGILTTEQVAHYHSVTFRGLQPDTLYAYRVGGNRHWSEWIQFRTAASEPAPFSFLYVGDAQNHILELWSRLIREGYRRAPEAAFIIHAGDLIDDAHSEQQWQEWFTAGGFIHRTLPSLPVAGNHEYAPFTAEEEAQDIEHLSIQWRPQFTLPENGIAALPETNYFLDYQGVRFVALNTNEHHEAQAEWLRGVLRGNPNPWTIAFFHHPLFSASADRDNEALRALWKPIFDEHGVDLALQGHDHAYARGRAAPQGENLLTGVNLRDGTGTVYVVSVSGGKMYGLRPEAWDGWPAERDRAAENTQLFQRIRVDGDTLSFESYTATGELYDAFDLVKDGAGGPNRFVERLDEAIPARRMAGTIPYQDVLPEAIRRDLQARYPGFEFDDVLLIDDGDFIGYTVEMETDTEEVNLKVTRDGRIVEAIREAD